jgi:hypothetical protein
MAKLITDASYKTRDKVKERKEGKNRGGFIDLTPKKARGSK